MSPFLDKLGVRGVVFDMDGILVDTMGQHYEAYRKVLEPEGLRVDPIDINSREGLGTPKVLRSLSEARGWRLTEQQVQELADRRRAIFWQFYEHRVYPEVPAILAWLAERHYRLAVVSGATPQSIEMCLNRFDAGPDCGPLGRWFPLVISGESVTRGKPHPDPYLKALEKMGLRGDQALVVENAPAGITAAKQAGCYCAAVQTTLPPEHLSDADWVVASHQELFELLKNGKT